jgi:hypothetical protein
MLWFDCWGAAVYSRTSCENQVGMRWHDIDKDAEQASG